MRQLLAGVFAWRLYPDWKMYPVKALTSS